MDLTATFLDYAEVEAPDDMESRSLRPLLEGRNDKGRDYVLSGLKGWRMIFDGRFKLISGFDEGILLFDLQEDPIESRNVAGVYPELVNRLSSILNGMLQTP